MVYNFYCNIWHLLHHISLFNIIDILKLILGYYILVSCSVRLDGKMINIISVNIFTRPYLKLKPDHIRKSLKFSLSAFKV